MFEHIDFSQLDDLSFKEDSVREEIITPILHRLGYSAAGTNKVVRSKVLEHPYVTIGSTTKRITVIPDYILQVNGVNKFVLDAKAPGQDIHIGKNVHQAYSYAFHPEIRSELFGLCNGKELAIFSTRELKKVLVIPIQDIEKQWTSIVKLISPLAFTHPEVFSFQPDYGIHLFRLGMDSKEELFFASFWINAVAMLETGKYMIQSSFPIDGQVFCASFDFSSALYSEFLQALPANKKELVHQKLNKYPFKIAFDSKEESIKISVHARLNDKFVEAKLELFLPFNVTQFHKKEQRHEL